MRKALITFVLTALVIIPLHASAQLKPRVGVLKFPNQISGLWWWNTRVASELQDLLASELTNTEQIVTRRLDFQAEKDDFTSSGALKSELLARPERTNLTHVVIPVISSFEKTDAKGGKFKVVIELGTRVIDAETGEISTPEHSMPRPKAKRGKARALPILPPAGPSGTA